MAVMTAMDFFMIPFVMVTEGNAGAKLHVLNSSPDSLEHNIILAVTGMDTVFVLDLLSITAQVCSPVPWSLLSAPCCRRLEHSDGQLRLLRAEYGEGSRVSAERR